MKYILSILLLIVSGTQLSYACNQFGIVKCTQADCFGARKQPTTITSGLANAAASQLDICSGAEILVFDVQTFPGGYSTTDTYFLVSSSGSAVFESSELDSESVYVPPPILDGGECPTGATCWAGSIYFDGAYEEAGWSTVHP